MPAKRRLPKPSGSTSGGQPFKIANKHKRTSHNVQVRSALSKAKRDARFERRREEQRNPELKEERLAQNVPATLDSKRVAVDTPWMPSAELMGRAKRKRDEMEGRTSTGSDGSDQEGGEEANGGDGWTGFGSENDDDEEDDEDEDMKDKDGSASDDEEDDDDLGSLLGSDSEDESSRKPAKTKPDPSKTKPSAPAMSAETLTTLLSLIPTASAPPKPLLTTTRRARQHATYNTLSSLLPNTTYVPRGNKHTIPQIATFAHNRQHTHLLVGLEDSKKLHGLIIILLPAGPTFHFSLTSWADGKAIQSRGVNTHHVPELILNNFTTPIGRLTAGLFQSLYPARPEFQGRQVVTLHNQRDYIFFRMHRYVFKDVEVAGERGRGDRTTGATQVGVGGEKAGKDIGVRVGLQELGPRFTLKLRRVERGVCEGVEWEWKGQMEKNRKMFHL